MLLGQWPAVAVIAGQEQVTKSLRISSLRASSAAWSCRRQWARKAASVDQPVVSKARRAAAMARRKSSAVPSAVTPIGASVKGSILSNVAPELALTSAPSIYIRHSAMPGLAGFCI